MDLTGAGAQRPVRAMRRDLRVDEPLVLESQQLGPRGEGDPGGTGHRIRGKALSCELRGQGMAASALDGGVPDGTGLCERSAVFSGVARADHPEGRIGAEIGRANVRTPDTNAQQVWR